MGARWDSTQGVVFLEEPGWQTSFDVLEIGSSVRPDYINGTFGCWAGLAQQRADDIEINVFPNPATHEAVISVSGILKGLSYELTVTDVGGKVHHTTTFGSYQQLTLPIRHLPPGVYFLNIDSGRKVVSRKLVVQ